MSVGCVPWMLNGKLLNDLDTSLKRQKGILMSEAPVSQLVSPSFRVQSASLLLLDLALDQDEGFSSSSSSVTSS